MEMSRIESVPVGERDDLLPLLDEELDRLPERYRAALVACELEGESRPEAARQLGLPEGTLSTHLRGGGSCSAIVCSGAGSAWESGRSRGCHAPSSRPLVIERLMDSTIQCRTEFCVRNGSGRRQLAMAVASPGRKGDQDHVPDQVVPVGLSGAGRRHGLRYSYLGLIAVAAGPPSDPIEPGGG